MGGSEFELVRINAFVATYGHERSEERRKSLGINYFMLLRAKKSLYSANLWLATSTALFTLSTFTGRHHWFFCVRVNGFSDSKMGGLVYIIYITNIRYIVSQNKKLACMYVVYTMSDITQILST